MCSSDLRGLRSILEETLLNTMFEIPSEERIASVKITEAAVRAGEDPIIMARPQISSRNRRSRTA